MENDIKKDQHFWHLITSTVYGAVSILMVAILWKSNRFPQNIPTFDFFMLTLATFRVTRLLVHDLVSDFIRDPLKNSTCGLRLTLHDLLDCPWCTGAWVALVICFVYFAVPFFWPIIFIMAIAGFGTLLTILASLMMASLKRE